MVLHKQAVIRLETRVTIPYLAPSHQQVVVEAQAHQIVHRQILMAALVAVLPEKPQEEEPEE